MQKTYRVSRSGDETGLKHIWKTVFGDSDEYIDAFFQNMYTPGCARLCESNGQIVSAAYLLELGNLVSPDIPAVPATVLYAFATLPEWRGAGIGGKVCNMLLRDSKGTARTVCPAEDSLFGYYKTCYGYEHFFYVYEKQLFAAKKPIDIYRVSASAYGEMREKLLHDRTHIRYSGKVLRYQQLLCRNTGGDMIGFEGGCAAYELRDGAVVLKELLTSGSVDNAAAAVCSALKMERAVFRTPYTGKLGNKRPFAMVMPDYFITAQITAPWFGFAFD